MGEKRCRFYGLTREKNYLTRLIVRDLLSAVNGDSGFPRNKINLVVEELLFKSLRRICSGVLFQDLQLLVILPISF